MWHDVLLNQYMPAYLPSYMNTTVGFLTALDTWLTITIHSEGRDGESKIIGASFARAIRWRPLLGF